ncbi:MAG: hypothetical protein KGD74_07310 [Candidatus Lokiarchaeota archaeon]|nr:hypothetical protein [Candidatus Lokiarchaeota archaeon]
MAIEKVREAVRIRLEEIYGEESEYQQLLSKIVIPFSEIFQKSRSSEFNSKINDLPFSEWDKKYKKILLKEL